MENVEFCGKTSKFLPERCLRHCLFIFCIFYLNEKELKRQVCLTKYTENEISNSNSHQKNKKKQREVSTKRYPTSKTSILKLLKNCH